MLRDRYRTDFRLWALIGACAFIVFGFLDPVAGVAKGDESLWGHVTDVLAGRWDGRTDEIVPKIILMTVVLAAAAATLAWVAQAFLVMFWFRAREPNAGPGRVEARK
jgi:hypothetical protein